MRYSRKNQFQTIRSLFFQFKNTVTNALNRLWNRFVPQQNTKNSAVHEPTQSLTHLRQHFTELLFSEKNNPRITAAFLLTVLNTIFNFLTPYLVGEVIENLQSLSQDEPVLDRSPLLPLALILASVAAYGSCQLIINKRDEILSSVSAETTATLMNRITRHILLEKSFNTHITTPQDKHLYLVQKGFPVVSRIGSPLLTQATPMFIEITTAAIVLYNKFGFGMSLGAAITFTFFTVYSALNTSKIIVANEQQQQGGNRAWNRIFYAVTNYKTIHDLNKPDYVMEEVHAATQNAADTDKMASIIPLRISLGHIAISRLAVLAALLHVGRGVLEQQYAVKEFVMLLGYLNQLSNLLPAFGLAINQLVATYPDLKFVMGEITKPSEIVDSYSHQHLVLRGPPTIRFDHVTFNYPSKLGEPEKPSVLRDVSFTVTAGQTVALVSESGGGKSTISNLIFRYYSPQQGRILIDGQDISQVSLVSLRSYLGMVGQKASLIGGTIGDNIKLGADNPRTVRDEEIFAFAKKIGLYDFLKSFPDGLNTTVGENGTALSGGQQQKVAILRGLLNPKPICFFDEITSALDINSANTVLHGIRTLFPATRFMITHKLNEIKNADLILVFEHGTITAQGNHAYLMENCEFYQKMCNQQNISPTNNNQGFFGASLPSQHTPPSLCMPAIGDDSTTIKWEIS